MLLLGVDQKKAGPGANVILDEAGLALLDEAGHNILDET